MRILIDMSSAQPMGNILTNGGGEYAVRIYMELVKRNLEGHVVNVLLNAQRGNNALLLQHIKKNQINSFYFNNIKEMEDIIEKGNYNTVFFPVLYPDYSEISLNKNQRIVGVIHDLSSFDELNIKKRLGDYNQSIINKTKLFLKWSILKSYFREKERKKHCKLFELSMNTNIITVSDYTKQRMKQYLPSARMHRIEVLYSPAKITNCNITEECENKILSQFNIEKKNYILLINASRWLKNNYRVIRAIDSLILNENKDIKILVIGADDFYKEKFKKNIKNINNFYFHNFICGTELEILYKSAKMFIYPSLLEGFGYPPLEAMKYGTMCLCSSSCSIPEVCGSAAIYFEPTDIQSIANAVKSSIVKGDSKELSDTAKCHYEKVLQRQKKDLETLLRMIREEV